MITSKIANGVKIKVLQTEHSVTGERVSKLQGRVLTLTHSVRNDNKEVIAFLLADDAGKVWRVFATDGKCQLTGTVVSPEGDYASKPIKIIKIEKA